MVKLRVWSIRMTFHAGSTSQFPRFGSMLAIRLSNSLARESCWLQRAPWAGGGVGAPPNSLKLLVGDTHITAAPTTPLTLLLHGWRHHVQLQELVQLVGGDLALVALPEAAVAARRDRLPGHLRDRSARGEPASRRPRHADRDPAHVDDVARPQVLFECLALLRPRLCRRRCVLRRRGRLAWQGRDVHRSCRQGPQSPRRRAHAQPRSKALRSILSSLRRRPGCSANKVWE